MSGETVLSCHGLVWEADGRRVLGPLDLAVERGECFVLAGPNGAGKTTLLRLLVGLLEPTSGEIRLAGRPCRRLARRELARHIAYVPQIRPARLPLTVADAVLLGRYPYLGRWQLAPAAADFAAVRAALAEVGIGELAGRRVDELSGGERQAVYIAAALAQEAEVLVLDEPTTHLDARHQRDIAALLARLRRRRDRTLLLATHDLSFAALLADRICGLREGRAVACGAPEELLRPEPLRRLFDAPFEVVRAGGRPVPLLRLEGP